MLEFRCAECGWEVPPFDPDGPEAALEGLSALLQAVGHAMDAHGLERDAGEAVIEEALRRLAPN